MRHFTYSLCLFSIFACSDVDPRAEIQENRKLQLPSGPVQFSLEDIGNGSFQAETFIVDKNISVESMTKIERAVRSYLLAQKSWLEWIKAEIDPAKAEVTQNEAQYLLVKEELEQLTSIEQQKARAKGWLALAQKTMVGENPDMIVEAYCEAKIWQYAVSRAVATESFDSLPTPSIMCEGIYQRAEIFASCPQTGDYFMCFWQAVQSTRLATRLSETVRATLQTLVQNEKQMTALRSELSKDYTSVRSTLLKLNRILGLKVDGKRSRLNFRDQNMVWSLEEPVEFSRLAPEAIIEIFEGCRENIALHEDLQIFPSSDGWDSFRTRVRAFHRKVQPKLFDLRLLTVAEDCALDTKPIEDVLPTILNPLTAEDKTRLQLAAKNYETSKINLSDLLTRERTRSLENAFLTAAREKFQAVWQPEISLAVFPTGRFAASPNETQLSFVPEQKLTTSANSLEVKPGKTLASLILTARLSQEVFPQKSFVATPSSHLYYNLLNESQEIEMRLQFNQMDSYRYAHGSVTIDGEHDGFMLLTPEIQIHE